MIFVLKDLNDWCRQKLKKSVLAMCVCACACMSTHSTLVTLPLFYSIVCARQCTCNLYKRLMMCAIMPVFSEASCSHVVELAKENFRTSSRPGPALRDFAKIDPKHGEEGCHRVFRKYGYVAPVTTETLQVDEGFQVPFIPFSSWVRFLLDTGRLPRQLCGVKSIAAMKPLLREFWVRHAELCPNHEIHGMDVDLSLTLPVYSHTDEGRTYKHAALWLLSTHGCLGRGSQQYVDSKKDDDLPIRQRMMGLNFIGSTWATQFLSGICLHDAMAEHPEAMNVIVGRYAADMATLARDGITSSDGRLHIRVIHLATKGDLPALSKLGGFKRHHSHCPRGASSKRACVGVCHQCLAGTEATRPGEEGFPYEDTSVNPCWARTIGSVDPWDSEPAILANLPVDHSAKAEFFSTDVWHCFHLGLSKHFFASSIVSIIERLDMFRGLSWDNSFRWLTSDFKAYCAANKIRPYLDEISRETLSFPSGNVCPVGRWSKGEVATQFMKYLGFFCQKCIDGQTHDELLMTVVPCRYNLAGFVAPYIFFCLDNVCDFYHVLCCFEWLSWQASAVRGINMAMSFMYGAGFWLSQADSLQLSKCLSLFLQGYTKCARLTLQAGKPRYALVPKLHFLCHHAYALRVHSQRCRWTPNPLATSVQQQEDWIGRPSRLSRRVNPRTLHSRVVQRSLICAMQALEDADSSF